MARVIIYVDGSARGNPGPAGIGVVIYDSNNKMINQIKRALSPTTNNIAEYEALICGLESALIHNADQVVVRSDSELVVRQSLGHYKVRAQHLKPLAEQVQRLIRGFDRVIFERIPREKNKQADRLARLASSIKKAPDESGDRS